MNGQGTDMKKRIAWFVSVLALSACRESRTERQEEKKQPPPEQGAGAPLANITREGLSISLDLRAHDGAKVRAGDDTDVSFRVTDEKTGAPLRNLRLFGWMSVRSGDAAPDEAGCKEQIKRYLGGFLSAQAEVDLNASSLWSLDDEPSISVMNPHIGFGRTKLRSVIPLSGKPFASAIGHDKQAVYVSIPESDEVAVIDTRRYRVEKRISVGDGPSFIVASPDGRRVWVGNDLDGTVSVLDARTNEVEKTLSVGQGHHRIVFLDKGSRAWITSQLSPELHVFDAITLELLHRIDIGAGAMDIDASESSGSVFVARRASGEIAVLDDREGKVVNRIEIGAGVDAVRFAPGGRFAFALAKTEGNVHIIDASTARIWRTLAGFASPDFLTFTERYAYIRHGGEGKISLIELPALEKGAEPAVIDVPVGQMPPRSASDIELSSPIAPMPEGKGVVVASPADRSFYVYVEGMMAPVGALPGSGREPRAIFFVDQKLREVEPGHYSTSARFERGGTYDVALLVESPRIGVCLEARVASSPGERLAAEERLHFEPLFDPRVRLEAGKAVTLRFRLEDGDSKDPLSEDEIRGNILRIPAGFEWHGKPRRTEEEHVYQFDVTPPRPGRYKLLVSVPSRDAKLGAIPAVTLGVGPREESGVVPAATQNQKEAP